MLVVRHVRMNKKLKAYQVVTLLLVFTVTFCLFKWWDTRNQMIQAAFVAFEIQTTQEIVSETKWTDRNLDAEAILMRLEFTMGYYKAHSNTLSRCPMLQFVNNEYDRMIRDVIKLLKKETGQDYGDDPNSWIDHYHKGMANKRLEPTR